MKRILFLILIGCCGIIGSKAQTMAFVSATAANDNEDGLSWETAKKTIAAGIAVAGNNGTVYVKVGTYNISNTLVIPEGVSVRGGFDLTSSGTDTAQLKQHLPGLNSQWANVSICTIIIGSGNHRIATVNGLLEACVLRRGFTNEFGGGVLIDGGTVRYCVIKECDAINENTFLAEGGGVYIRNNGLLTNCVITECRGDKGPAVSGGNGSLINNTITRNWPTHCGTVADYDGNVYNTVVIGQQCWTKQNMRTMHYYDGTIIPMGSENSLFDPYYYVNYNAITPAMLSNYGYLYNWTAAMHGAPSSSANPSGVTGICPLGWHLPSDSEYVEMKYFVNTILANRCNGNNNEIAKSLSSRTGWPSSSSCSVGSNQSTNNNTLFSAYPAGYYDNGFSSRNCANLWTATQTSSIQAITYYMNFDNAYLNRDANGNKTRASSVRCVKQLSVSDPVVHTAFVTILTATSVECGGTCSDGGTPITAYGLCWSTSPNPTVSNNHSVDGAGEANFTTVIPDLTPNTTYYVRAYIMNANGVYYGEERSFIPTSECGVLVIHDYDGNNYNTVQLGDQCWMKENLRTTHYTNGDPIPTSTSYSYDSPYCYWNSDRNEMYYNWSAVMHGETYSEANPSGVQGVCPNGWHVPSSAEWGQLKNYVSSQSEYVCEGNTSNIAKSLAATINWNSNTTTCAPGKNQETNNATGFTAFPVGCRETSSYSGNSNYAYFWTCSVNNNDSNYPIYYQLSYNSATLYTNSTYSRYRGHSVRCVRDN